MDKYLTICKSGGYPKSARDREGREAGPAQPTAPKASPGGTDGDRRAALAAAGRPSAAFSAEAGAPREVVRRFTTYSETV